MRVSCVPCTDRAQHTTSGDLIAVKVIPYAGGALDQRLLKEVKVHSALKNANVLEVLGSEVDQDGSRKEWGIGPAFFILLEFAAGGDLFDKIGAPKEMIGRERQPARLTD